MNLKILYILVITYIIGLVSAQTSFLPSIDLYPLFIDLNGFATFYVDYVTIILISLMLFVILWLTKHGLENKKNPAHELIDNLTYILMIVYLNGFLFMVTGWWVNQFALIYICLVYFIFTILRFDYKTKNYIGRHILLNRFNKDDLSIFALTTGFYYNNLPLFMIFLCFGIFILDPVLLISFIVITFVTFLVIIQLYSFKAYRRKHPFSFSRPTEFIFLSSAHNEWDEQGIITGTNDIPLTGESIAQVYEIKETLDNLHFAIDEIIVAPDLGPRMTASILNQDKKIKIKQIRYLKNRNLGEAEGQPVEIWKEKIKEQQVEGMESEVALVERIRPFINYLSENYSAKRVLIVCNEDIIRACLLSVTNEWSTFHEIHIDALKFARIAKSESGSNNFEITDINKNIRDII